MTKTISEAIRDPDTFALIEPQVIECVCGAPVALWSSWANGCDGNFCDQEYNGSGQALAPRTQWGEETGETF